MNTNFSESNNANSVLNYTYCNLTDFSRSYRDVHGYLSILVCVFGSLANILNICVLTTKEMRWPTNFILTGLAVADMLVMLEYIPFVCHAYFQTRVKPYHYSYGWAVYLIFHALYTQVFHFISCYLTVILAIWRYIAITHPQNNKIWCNNYRTKLAIALTYVTCTLLSLPLFLSLKINPTLKSFDENDTMIPYDAMKNYTGTMYNATIYLINYSDNFKIVSFWMYSVVMKLIPCILLSILSKQLISALLKAKERRRKLFNKKPIPLQDSNGKKAHCDKEQQTDRTTRMLLAVLLLFLITEFPQAILGLLSVLIGLNFEQQCYIPLGNNQF